MSDLPIKKHRGRTPGKTMHTVSFQIPPADYEEAKTAFAALGLTTGAGIRFALKEFLRNREIK